MSQDASPLSYCTLLIPYVPKEECFFQLPGQNLSNSIDVKLMCSRTTMLMVQEVCYTVVQ